MMGEQMKVDLIFCWNRKYQISFATLIKYFKKITKNIFNPPGVTLAFEIRATFVKWKNETPILKKYQHIIEVLGEKNIYQL